MKAPAPVEKASSRPPLKREDSNPFAADEDDEVVDDEEDDEPPARTPAPAPKPAAAPAPKAASTTPATAAKATAVVPTKAAASLKTAPSVTPTPSPKIAAASPSVTSVKSTVTSSNSTSSSARTATSPPSLQIDDPADIDLDSINLPPTSTGPLSPASVKRESYYQQRLKKTIAEASRIGLTSFKDDFDPKKFTATLTSPLFTLIREKYPVEDEDDELARQEEEEEEDEGDEGGEGEGGAAGEQKKREQQLKRGSEPRLRRRPFDPEPFSALFSLALTRLDTLRDQLDSSIISGNVVTQRAEAEHSRRMSAFTSSLTSLTTRFQRLDSRISSVSHTAVRIGSTLDHINTTKLNNVKAYDLITHFIAFNTGDPTRISPLFTAQKLNELYRAAEVIQTLESITQEVRVQGTDKAVQLIQKTSEEVESNLLTRFEDAMQRGNMEEMKE